MEDILTAHADRVRDANERHAKRAEAIRAEASADLAAVVTEFSEAMLKTARELAAAHEAAIAKMGAVASRAQTALDDAFTENVMAISASEAAMHSGIAERQTFFATGKLPQPTVLPNTKDDPPLSAQTDHQSEPTKQAA